MLVLDVGCGGSVPAPDEARVDPLAPSTLYPLVEGAVWSHDVDTGDGIPTLAITRVVRRVGSRVEVSSGSEPVVYELRPLGIFRPATAGWLLRAPIEVGATWQSAPGRQATVRSVTEQRDVEGQPQSGCVRVEELEPRVGRSIVTVFCPGIGPVWLETSVALATTRQTVTVRAELRGHDLRGDRPASP